MTRSLSANLVLIMLLCACSRSAHPTQSPEPASDIGSTTNLLKEEFEPKLKSILPNGWSMTLVGNTFELTRTEKLWVYNPIQRDVRERLEDTVRGAGTELTYAIRLRFEPLMKKEEYERLKRERAPFERIVNEGASTVDEWMRGVSEFHKHQIPVYFTDRYSIYADKPDGFPERVYPEAAGVDCNRLLDSLDRIFNRYEPRTGKASDFHVRT